MPIKQAITKNRVPVKIWTNDIETKAYQQLIELSQMPFIHSHLAVMPDVHFGCGSTVGSVIPTVGAIIPSAVGVDIGCGMNAVRLSLKAYQLPDNLKQIRSEIEKYVPVGFAKHSASHTATRYIPESFTSGLRRMHEKHPQMLKMQKNPTETWMLQAGTLGGGNHFIELCLDENQDVWVMLHSGSRGIGNVIGRYFIKQAKIDMERNQINLPNADLAYIKEGAEYFDDYITAVNWAQDYAEFNRQELMALVVQSLKKYMPSFEKTKEAVNCHHNYITEEMHFGKDVYITRKGAIKAGVGDLGIIPGSMGTKSFIVKGKGNPQSFNSCSHGAGRRMSRTQARKQFNSLDLIKQTAGVECRKDESVIDEIPNSYKDIDEVMSNQCDLVDIVHTLKQVLCVKG